MHVGISLEPAVVLGLMGIEVVEDDMDSGVTIDSDDVVHEVEKLDAAATLFVSDSDLSGGNLEGSKQGRSTVTLVVMTMTGECPASGELQVSLRPLQRLDRRLFVDTDDDGVLRRRDIEPNYIGGFGGEFGIVAFAPGFTPRKVDLLDAQKAPDLLLMHIAQGLGQQRSCPAGISLRRRFIQQRQNTPAGRAVVLRRRTGVRPVFQSGEPLAGEAATPATHRARHRAEFASNRARRAFL